MLEKGKHIHRACQGGKEPVTDADMGAVPKVPLLAGKVAKDQDGQEQKAQHPGIHILNVSACQDCRRRENAGNQKVWKDLRCLETYDGASV